MPETKTVTVNAYHPYPAFYWEFKLAGGVAADIEDYDAYQRAGSSGQGTKTVAINATVDDVGSIRCTVGPESAGVPTPDAEGTVTTDWIPVSVGALTWDVDLEAGKTEIIQVAPPPTFAWDFTSGDIGDWGYARSSTSNRVGQSGWIEEVTDNVPLFEHEGVF